MAVFRCLYVKMMGGAEAPIDIGDEAIAKRYIGNNITQAIVFGGLEPMEQFDELVSLVKTIRKDFRCQDDIVIYTGYNHDEIRSAVEKLKEFDNIIIKFGRYIPNIKRRFDEVLGVNLASDNQYAEKIS